MRRILLGLVVVGLVACGNKKEPTGAAGSGDPNATKPVEPKPVSCPPGNAVKDGACVVVVTPEKIAAVAQQQSRLDELAALLDKIDAVTAPIELLDGIRQLDQWKQLAATSDKLKILDTVVVALNDAVKQLRAFKASLGEASARLGNLKGELDKMLADKGVARNLEELRATVSSQLRTAIEPLGTQVSDTIQKAIAPLAAQLADTSDLVIGACAMAKLSGGGDKLKALCAQAKDVFGKATAYVDDLKAKPAKLFHDVVTQLQTQLDQLVDTETQKLLAAAQTKVNDALKLPPAPAGSGSGSAH
jgi:hypothetical protein